MDSHEIADRLNTLQSFKVSSNKDQIENHPDLVANYDWRVHSAQPNRIWVNFQDKPSAEELLQFLKDRNLVWFKNWID